MKSEEHRVDRPGRRTDNQVGPVARLEESTDRPNLQSAARPSAPKNQAEYLLTIVQDCLREDLRRALGKVLENSRDASRRAAPLHVIGIRHAGWVNKPRSHGHSPISFWVWPRLYLTL